MHKLSIFKTTDEYNGENCSLEDNTISYVKENELTILRGGKSQLTAIYNVTSTTNKTSIFGDGFSISQVSKMYIDDIEVTPTRTYTFSTNGEHTVKCEFCELTNCSDMFNYCQNLISLDLSDLDTSNVIDMSSIFEYCSGLKSLDLTPLNTSKVTNMSGMFYYCSGLTYLDLTPLDTSKVTDMNWMFAKCYSLTSLNLSGLDTSNVTTMSAMFFHCYSLTSLDLSCLDTSKVTSMSSIFYYCRSLTSLIITSDISKVTSYYNMFDYVWTNGTLTYNCAYEDKWNEILSSSSFPSTWTKTCVTV